MPCVFILGNQKEDQGLFGIYKINCWG